VIDRRFGLTLKAHASFGEALNTLRQCCSCLCGASPDVAGECDGVRIVVAAAGDASHLGPALKGERHGGSATRAEVNEYLLVAPVRGVLVGAQLLGVEPNCVLREHGLGVERRASYLLAERAMAGKSSQRRLGGAKPDPPTETPAFKFFCHELVPLRRAGLRMG